MDIQHKSSEPDKILREGINEALRNKYGIDTVTGLPIWRLSWSEDQFEKRLGTFRDITPGGVYLRTVTEVREVPKYSQYCSERYVLENLVGLDPSAQMEIKDATLSYEPIQPIQHAVNHSYLPPRLDVCEFYVDLINAAKGKTSMAAKYKDPDADGNNGLTAKAKRVAEIMEYLYGNDSGLGGAIVYGEGVSMHGPRFEG